MNPEVPTVAERPPTYAHPGDAGADLTASETVTIPAAGGRALVPTSIRIALPEGFAGFVLPRSGLAAKHGITLLNTPGLIDSGYRGELKVLLINTDPTQDYTVQPGDRIAQLVVQPVAQAVFRTVDELDDHVRGEGGFGSTGA